MQELMTNQNLELKMSMNNLKKTYSNDFNQAIDKITTRVNKLFDKVKEINKAVQQQTEVLNNTDISRVLNNTDNENANLSTNPKINKKFKILKQLSTMSVDKY